MNYFRARYFGAKYNIPFTLPPNEIPSPNIQDYDVHLYKQGGLTKEEIERRKEILLQDDLEILEIIKMWLKCQN